MSEPVVVAVIAAAPPTAAAILGYAANRRSLRRAVGSSPGLSLARILERMEASFSARLDRIETKLDRVVDQHAAMRERLARLETARAAPTRKPR